MRLIEFVLATAVFAHLSAAQAQDPRGYRGRWNGWNYDAMALTQGIWRVTVQAEATEDNEFKLASSDWSYEWTYGGALPLAQVRTAYTSGGNTELAATPGRRYTFALEDADSGAQSRMIVQETAADPVAVTSVTHVLDGSNAVVTIGTSAAPSAGERIFVRGSFDNWTSSSFFEASG
ncbi:MAG TPA: hypothetical protein PK388_03930, partial [Kiritimatiellia bacterium]|nr:hypothetical protein [Kiritimatiellia bacterium]